MLDTNGIINYTFVDLRLAQIANISAVSFHIYIYAHDLASNKYSQT